MNAFARVLTIAVLVLNIGDIVLHVVIDDVEPLRIAGNVVVLLATIALLFWPSARRSVVPLLAAIVSLGLNLAFIATEGIGPLGAVLVATTTLLLAGVGLAMRRDRLPRDAVWAVAATRSTTTPTIGSAATRIVSIATTGERHRTRLTIAHTRLTSTTTPHATKRIS